MNPPDSAAGAGGHYDALYDALVVGAGFAGLYMLYRLRLLGLRAHLLEAGDDVGGTWYWNRYPGARCDVESVDYSYSFSASLEQEWNWSERFASQSEILRYLQHVAERFDLKRDISLGTRVAAAHYDEARQRWLLRSERGGSFAGRFCIMATGCLSVAAKPDLPGLGDFRGQLLYTSSWPQHEVKLAGERVGVIGTGSSGIQLISAIAAEVAQLHVFQRTPSFSVPAGNAPLSSTKLQELKAGYAERRDGNRRAAAGYVYDPNYQSALEVSAQQREQEYEARWRKGGAGFMVAYKDLLLNQAANDTAAEFVRAKIRAIVRDPATAAALCPQGFPMGARRLCLDTGYYQAFNRANVQLVDLLRSPLERIVAEGVRTVEALYPLDTLILATGFDAMTGPLLAIDVRGRAGLPLRTHWADGPRSYLGLSIAGFPNLFVVAGPGSPSVLSNMVLSIEQHVDWIADCLAWLRRQGLHTIEAQAASEAAWVAHVNEVAGRTLYPSARTWYTGSNIAGKPRVFMPYVGGAHRYRQRCEQVAAQQYEGFAVASGVAAGA